MDIHWTIVLFIILLAMSAFFSGVEIAFFSLSPARVRTMRRHRLRFAELVEKLRSRPQDLLVTILIGNNLVNVATASLATSVAISWFGSIGVGVATGVVTLALLIFGEIFPKTLAQSHAETVARWGAHPIRLVSWILFPAVWLLGALSRLLTRWTGAKTRRVTEEEIRSLVHIGLEEGAVEPREHAYIEKLLRFNDVAVREVMTPLSRTVILSASLSVQDAYPIAIRSGYSRWPVQNHTGRFIGSVHFKDLLRVDDNREERVTIGSLVRPAVTIPVGAHLDDVFQILLRRGEHLALVTEPHKKVVGVVTLEDLLEELVGEIGDESDRHKTNYRRVAPHR